MTKVMAPPPDGGWGWMVVLGFFGCMFVIASISRPFGILLYDLVAYFDSSFAMGAGILGVRGIFFIVCGPFCLAFGRRYSQRAVVMVGGFIGGLGVSLCYFMLSIEYIICVFGITVGFANACMIGNGIHIVGQYFEKRRSFATALALAGGSVANFVAPPIVQALLDAFGLHGSFLILGGFYLNVMVFGSLYRPIVDSSTTRDAEERKQHKEASSKYSVDLTESHHSLCTQSDVVISPQFSLTTDDVSIYSRELELTDKVNRFAYLSEARNQVMGSVESLEGIVRASENSEPEAVYTDMRNTDKKFLFPKVFFWTVFKMPVVIIFTVVMFLTYFGYFSFIIFMPPDAVSRGRSKYEKTLLVSLSGIGDLIGKLLIGVIGDLGLMKRYKMMSLVCALCGLNVMLFDFATSYWWMAIHVTLYGMFGGAYIAVSPVVLTDLVGLETLPKALSTILLFKELGAGIGQPIEGWIRDMTLSYRPLNYLNGICMILGSTILFCHPMFLRRSESLKTSLTPEVACVDAKSAKQEGDEQMRLTRMDNSR